MTQHQVELHEQFVKGITWKMIGLAIIGIISVVSSFWVGYNALRDDIKTISVKVDSNHDKDVAMIANVQAAVKRSQDSLQRIEDVRWQYVFDVLSSGHSKSGIEYLTQTTGANGEPIFHPHYKPK